MKEESEKYKQVMTLIRKSKPVLKSTDEVENEVIKRISSDNSRGYNLTDIADVVFGWVYIGWIRRTLVTASFALVLFFAWQQGVMMKQISFLSRQTVIVEEKSFSSPSYEIEKGIMMFKLSGKRLPAGMITISERKMNQLLESVDELKEDYNELIDLISNDPELKKIIEDKLNEKQSLKIKL